MLTASGEELASLFGLGSVPKILKRHNSAPGQEAAGVVSDHGSKALVNAAWGWVRKDGRPGSSDPIINARVSRPVNDVRNDDPLCLLPDEATDRNVE